MSGQSESGYASPVEEFRQALIEQLRRELIGPDPLPGHSEEILGESPRQRYSAGVLFPARATNPENEDVTEGTEATEPDAGAVEGQGQEPQWEQKASGSVWGREDVSGEYDETITLANSYLPAAMGISFISDYPDGGLELIVEASRYETKTRKDGDRELTEWHRQKLDIPPIVVRFSRSSESRVDVKEYEVIKDLKARMVIRRRDNGTFLITASVYNAKTAYGDAHISSSDCFFQAGFRIRETNGKYIFMPYQQGSPRYDDPEEAGLALLFRNRRSYGVGHGCAARWSEEKSERTNFVATDSLPFLKIPPVEPRQTGGDELSMLALSGGKNSELEESVPIILEGLTNDYADWIADAQKEALGLPESFRNIADLHLAKCSEAMHRLSTGIEILKNDPVARRAFCLANRAMLMQQYHSRRKTRSVADEWEDFPSDYTPAQAWMGKWRTFQIAFILMNIASITPRSDGSFSDERELVDLIWFPTGGGKTEAYLGLAAYTIFLRRLLKPENAGCTVLMRYTLRLLTAQQFQRASALVCSCEVIRQHNESELGNDRITIGLWVGQSLTPNRREEAISALNILVRNPGGAENKFQILKCPWCGTRLDEKRHLGYRPSGRSPRRVLFVCPESRCHFNSLKSSLPILVTDEDIYDEPPTLLIGTVDKFAMLAWREEAQRLFGNPNKPVNTPPDLVIQDELHLISGPLGSMVGLFEGVIDLLCSYQGRRVKVVGSTATIRRANEQCFDLYDRAIFQFPPPGIDISDSFFAKENPTAPGRIYAGVFPTASSSFVTALRNTAGSLLQGCKTLELPDGADESVRDPYWTLVEYFNSLRELGRALTLLQADIPEYMWTIASRTHIPREKVRTLMNFEELTSRKTAQDIPMILEQLEVRYPPDKSRGEYPIDTLLATNMISVGVDVDRLGLMCVVGQPKTTSEYIQASSRVGRSKDAPGLVVALYNPGKPRDRSHFEQFHTYHSSLYRYVEPTSVTPYSIPVLERALHALLVMIARQYAGLREPTPLDRYEEKIRRGLEFVVERCRHVDPEHLDAFKARIDALIDLWQSAEPDEWGRFGEASEQMQPLMYPAGSTPLSEWHDMAWATPSSMRAVDTECEAYVPHVYPD